MATTTPGGHRRGRLEPGARGALRSRGWRHLVVPHTGYAGPDFVRVLARVVLAPHADDPVERADRFEYRRGWRNFLTAEAMDVEVTVEMAGEVHRTRTNRSGHVDVRLPNPGLAPGWADVTLTAPGSEPAQVPIRVVAGDETFGLVSDIDDTVIRTSLPRPLLAAYNTLVVQEQSRRPVPGMAALYDAVLADHPGAPTVYVSTGAWNTAPTLTRFLARHGFPAGPLMLTDWGPTNTGWFRSGQDAQARLPDVAGGGLPGHPLGAGGRRRPARPRDLCGFRARAPRPRPGDRPARADRDPAGAQPRHPHREDRRRGGPRPRCGTPRRSSVARRGVADDRGAGTVRPRRHPLHRCQWSPRV